MGALDDGVKVAAVDAAEWGRWLEENHTVSKGAWLLRGRGADAGRYVEYEEAICEALCFGWIDGPVRVFDELSSGLRFAPRQPRSGWAATNKARIARLEERLAFHDRFIHSRSPGHVVGFHRQKLLQGRGGSVCLQRPHFHFPQPLAAELSLVA